MMIDQLSTQLVPVETDGSQAAAPASDAPGMPDAGQSSSSQTPPLPEVNSPAAAGSAAVKPRVFKMSDEFLMFKFKIEMCSRKDRHDWKICPYAHPGEVARRRHPRGYTAVLCPAKTAASCPRREQCTFAHNPFEFWLHPDRFKTSLCNQGPNCDRPICFFAHKDEEVRRLAHGLEAAGPDDYVYATAATPEPHSSDASAAHPPPPPPPPRMNSLGHAGSGALGFLQGSTIVAAAAAAAAAAASLNSSGLLLGASPAQQYQQMMMAGGEEALLQAAGSGLLPDAASALCGSSWLNSNSDPSLLNSLTASGRQLSATSPVPMPQPYSSGGSAAGRALRSSLPAAAGMMGVQLDQSAAMAAAAGLDASMLAGMQGMPLSHQLSGSSVSLAGAAGMAGKAAGLAGSAPAGFSMLGGDLTGSAYQQQLLQQLQMEQQQQQQQMSQQQLLQDQLVLQQQLQALIQQQAMAAASASSSSLQQLVQQQQAQLQLQQMAAVQHQAAQQQQQQQWHSSMLASQPLAASAPASQLLWQQQQQQQQQPPEASQMQHGSYGSSSSMTPPDSTLASMLGGVGSKQTGVMSPTQQVACTAPPAYGLGQRPGQQQQGMLKWSSSVLSKRGSGHIGSNGGQDALQHQASLEASAGREAAVIGLLGPATGVAGVAAAGGSMLPPSGSSGVLANSTLDQLNGLLQMVHVSSSTAMSGPSGPGF